jgi:DUF971 family protein
MSHFLLFIKEIYQKDNTSFCIRWMDDRLDSFHLAQLQRNCPCKQCRDPLTGAFIKNGSEIVDTLRAKRIISVGNYALRVEFTTGCQHGIYTYSFLRALADAKLERGVI